MAGLVIASSHPLQPIHIPIFSTPPPPKSPPFTAPSLLLPLFMRKPPSIQIHSSPASLICSTKVTSSFCYPPEIPARPCHSQVTENSRSPTVNGVRGTRSRVAPPLPIAFLYQNRESCVLELITVKMPVFGFVLAGRAQGQE